MASKPQIKHDLHRYVAPVVGPDDPRVITDSGIEIDPLYDAEDVADGLEERLGEPGQYPFTRGIHERMYRDRLWTMRQYAGFSSPEDTNNRYRYLLEHGSTGLSMAFDLPTQLGRDKAQQAAGEGLVLRRMVFHVDRTLWTADDARRPFEGTFNSLVNGWVLHNFKEQRFAIDGTAWPEDGGQYIAPISIEDGKPKLELPAAVFPLTDAQVKPAPTQETPLRRLSPGTLRRRSPPRSRQPKPSGRRQAAYRRARSGRLPTGAKWAILGTSRWACAQTRGNRAQTAATLERAYFVP